MADHDREPGSAVSGDDYGFWNDEPTHSLRGLFSTGSHRRQRHTAEPAESFDTDPTPTAAYDPWLDDDLNAVSFHSAASPADPSTSSYRYADDDGYGWSIEDDDEDQEIRRAAPLATVSSGGRAPIDPLLKRIGVIAAALALALPLGLALRGGNDAKASMKAPPTAESSRATTSLQPSSLNSKASTTTVTTVAGLVETAPRPLDLDAVTSTSAYPTSSVSPVTEKSTPRPAAKTQAAAGAASASTQKPRVESLPNLVCGYSSYRVVKGDFWAQIAKKADVRLSDLLTVNQSTVDTPLFPGDKVCMPPNARSTTTSAAPTSTAEASTTAAPTTEAPTTAAPTTAAPTTAAPTTAAPTTAAPTTAAPTTKPPQTSTPAGAAPPASYTRDQVIQIIRDAWPDDLEERAIQIAQRESNLQPGVRNWCCFGLFQIYFNSHKSWLANYGVTSAEQLYDPNINAKMAYVLYQRAGGWGPWSTA